MYFPYSNCSSLNSVLVTCKREHLPEEKDLVGGIVPRVQMMAQQQCHVGSTLEREKRSALPAVHIDETSPPLADLLPASGSDIALSGQRSCQESQAETLGVGFFCPCSAACEMRNLPRWRAILVRIMLSILNGSKYLAALSGRDETRRTGGGVEQYSI